MKTFLVTIDDTTEILKAKYSGNGEYIFKSNKTNNLIGIHKVREINSNGKTRYIVSSFYAFSPALRKKDSNYIIYKIA